MLHKHQDDDADASTDSVNLLAGRVRSLEARFSAFATLLDDLKPQLAQSAQFTSSVPKIDSRLDELHGYCHTVIKQHADRGVEFESKIMHQDLAITALQEQVDLLSKVFVFIDVESFAKQVNAYGRGNKKGVRASSMSSSPGRDIVASSAAGDSFSANCSRSTANRADCIGAGDVSAPLEISVQSAAKSTQPETARIKFAWLSQDDDIDRSKPHESSKSENVPFSETPNRIDAKASSEDSFVNVPHVSSSPTNHDRSRQLADSHTSVSLAGSSPTNHERNRQLGDSQTSVSLANRSPTNHSRQTVHQLDSDTSVSLANSSPTNHNRRASSRTPSTRQRKLDRKGKNKDRIVALRHAFRKYDPDGSGAISASQMTAVLQNLMPGITNAAARDLFKSAHMGCDGKFNYSELIKWMTDAKS